MTAQHGTTLLSSADFAPPTHRSLGGVHAEVVAGDLRARFPMWVEMLRNGRCVPLCAVTSSPCDRGHPYNAGSALPKGRRRPWTDVILCRP